MPTGCGIQCGRPCIGDPSFNTCKNNHKCKRNVRKEMKDEDMQEIIPVKF